MHNNFYFLQQLSKALHQKLVGFSVVSCFSQNKEELILELNNSSESFFIKASLHSSFCCLSFPGSFNRAKKNSIDLFNEIVLKKVRGVRQFTNERSFALVLENNLTLLFKMHGNLANVVLFREDQAIEVFRNQFEDDFQIQLHVLDRTIDWSRENFEKSDNLSATYFTFGKEVCKHLEGLFSGASSGTKWEAFQNTLKQLEQPEFYIVESKMNVALSSFPAENILAHFTEPIEAINDFFYRYTSSHTFADEKTRNARNAKEALKRAESYILKNQQKLNEIKNDQHYQLWADLIMANMHLIKMGMKGMTLINFYTGAPEEIKLKAELNAQQNAEAYYRKAKNQQIEINKLQESLQSKQREFDQLTHTLVQIESASDVKAVRKLVEEKPIKTKRNVEPALPYHIFEHQGFQIWVGRNAQANDELTLKYSFKEDLWLHAKDVPGSHVLIKHQSGKKIPKEVIERAAELAAYNSKRKTESLCPVTVTPKKFVRKRKGDPAGAVVVEKEDVILVRPRI